MLNKIFIFGLFVLTFTTISLHANQCSSLFDSSSITKVKQSNLIELIKNSAPLQQEYNQLSTAKDQLSFLKQKMNQGMLLVEVQVGKFFHMKDTKQANMSISNRYYLLDNLGNTSVMIDLRNNKFQTQDKYGNESQLVLDNSLKVIEYFSGVQKTTWSPEALAIPARTRLGISSYPTKGYWKIDNPPEFSDYEVGNFYLNVYRANSSLPKTPYNQTPYKILKLNREI